MPLIRQQNVERPLSDQVIGKGVERGERPVGQDLRPLSAGVVARAAGVRATADREEIRGIVNGCRAAWNRYDQRLEAFPGNGEGRRQGPPLADGAEWQRGDTCGVRCNGSVVVIGRGSYTVGQKARISRVSGRIDVAEDVA